MSEGGTAGTTTGHNRAAGDQLANDLAGLIREELSGLRDEWTAAIRGTAGGGLLMAAAGGCTALAAGAASTTLLRLLDAVLPRRLAAAGLTAGYLASAVALGALGLRRLRKAGGASERLAEEIRAKMTATAGELAGTSAARRVAGRWTPSTAAETDGLHI
ncbi:phage holin family protein [Dactylosporangium roseum]|uniref:Phage holin family protein n=1 Tax=Dactylosporangium roseum TaxID=47989 RepID=A0ABY5ZGB1_9ACTN|nr:phage holin family protein [Dactylosporangium roseum]UWZ39738.1 phage holin family protein [Dactylosporangium roseum]